MARQTGSSSGKPVTHAEDTVVHAEKSLEHAKKAAESAREAEKKLMGHPEEHEGLIKAVREGKVQAEQTAEQVKRANEETKKTVKQIRRTARAEKVHDTTESTTGRQ